jgi:hypothetical protein
VGHLGDEDCGMALVLIVLAVVWGAVVTATVIGSAPSGGAEIAAFDRALFEPGTPEGVWFLCALSASAAFALAWAFGAWSRRRQRARMSAELDERWAQRSHEATAEEVRGRLLESRERDLDDMVQILTAQRDALLGEIATLRAESPGVIQVPDADTKEVDRAG